MKVKKKILFIITSMNVGGIEKYLLRFLENYGKNIDITVLCKSGNAGELELNYLEVGAKILKLKINYLPILSGVKFYQFIKLNRFDVVCDFTGDFSGLTLLISRISNIPKRIAFYRGSTYRFKRTFLRLLYARMLNRLVYYNASKILSNSKSALDFFHPNWKLKSERFKIIRNGIPKFDKFKKHEIKKSLLDLGIPDKSFVIGHVGRFDDSKNYKNILSVANIMCRRHENVYFLLCGLGVREGLLKLNNNKKLNSRIIAPGIRTDISLMLCVMDAFYFPSLTEGQPNALLEALIMGLPFVASDIEPIKECVPKEFHHCLVSPHEDKKSSDILSSYIYSSNLSQFISLAHEISEAHNQEDRFQEFLAELEVC